MANNLSVEQFKQLMASITPALAQELDKAVREQAERLAESQRSSAPSKSGNLRASVRVEKGRKPLTYVVRAGGPLTTREARKGSGKPYDYSLGTEFGNEKTRAQPFFFPTYRLMKPRLRAGIARKVKPAMQKIVRVE